MKKLKRLLIATLAMMLVLVMMPAQTMRTVQAEPTIDTNQKGSLTLYKYEVGSDYRNDVPGTGETTAKPDGATALKGVGFTLYQVSDLEHYYNGTNKPLPTTKPSDSDKASYKIINQSGAEVTGSGNKEFFSNEDGMVQWQNLPLGIYYVEETTTPQNVISVPVWFYVSVPMTSVDGDEWLYDVVVYPKNTTTYANLSLKKTGNGTALEGAKFVLQYKKEDADPNWSYVNITNPDTYSYDTTTYSDELLITTPSNGMVSFENLRKGYYRFIEVDAPSGYIKDGKTAYEFEVQNDGTIVYESNQGLSSYDSENKVITIDNQKPEVDKKVLKKNGTKTKDSDWVEAADYSVGDVVPFKITSTVPKNIKSLTHYVLTDEMSSGLTLENDTTVQVKYYTGVNEVTGTSLPTAANKTINGWTLDLSGNVNVLGTNNIDTIVVTFDATLNVAAVTAGNGNPNDIYLEYTNNIIPEVDGEGNPIDPDNPNKGEKEETITIVDRAVVYTFGMELVKTFEGASPSNDIKATFDLYRTAVAGDVSTKTIKYEGNDVSVVEVGTYTTDASGKITIDTEQTAVDNDKAFSLGDYYFVETETADNYNLLKNPVKATISVTYTPTITTTKTTTQKYNTDGTVIQNETVTTGTVDTSTTFSPTMTGTNSTIAVTISVVNNKGFTLPVTGGMGMFSFIIVGVSMMIAAVILFITSKKKEATEK